jgi:hypothetical protein
VRCWCERRDRIGERSLDRGDVAKRRLGKVEANDDELLRRRDDVLP